MNLVWDKQFLSGNYQSLIDSMENGGKYHAPSAAGSLVLLGRSSDSILFASRELAKCSIQNCDPLQFFLFLAHTRLSQYSQAEDSVRKLKQSKNYKSFFFYQAAAILDFYNGKREEGLKTFELARQAAIEIKDNFARFISTEALGHNLVQLGEISRGISLIEEAAAICYKLGNSSAANSIVIAKEIYEAEFGINSIAKLEQRYRACGNELPYSKAELSIELARQYTLRGRYSDAELILAQAAPIIYILYW